ncbi:DUF1090 domain-containing protein [Orbus wheelerorum]|uniref:DUF1090 domain-containing protein n=1 Tax=Orbus wheelerorum TaxID=3074111 RepID=UPI00370D711F
MNKIIKVSFITLAAAISFNALANHQDYDGSTCAGKKSAIQTQIDYAKKANNTYQVKGLEKALSDVNSYCTNSDLEKKYKEKVQDKLNDVQEKQADLKQAQLEGNTKKIAKQQAKLAEKQQELQNAKDTLDGFYKAVKAGQ